MIVGSHCQAADQGSCKLSRPAITNNPTALVQQDLSAIQVTKDAAKDNVHVANNIPFDMVQVISIVYPRVMSLQSYCLENTSQV